MVFNYNAPFTWIILHYALIVNIHVFTLYKYIHLSVINLLLQISYELFNYF